MKKELLILLSQNQKKIMNSDTIAATSTSATPPIVPSNSFTASVPIAKPVMDARVAKRRAEKRPGFRNS